MTDPITPEITHWRWSDRRGEPRVDGIRLSRGSNFLFIPDDAILETANALADHLAKNNSNA